MHKRNSYRLLVPCLGALLLNTLLSGISFGQAPVGSVKGKVMEAATKQPIIGANIRVEKPSSDSLSSKILGVSTDENGLFLLTNIPEGRQTLIISFIGFEEKQLTDVQIVRDKILYYEIELMESQISLEEVEVTTRRYEKDPMHPISTTSFNREEIFRNPGAQGDVFRAIGIMPGVSSTGNQYSSFAVRGQGVRDNLIMVDDIPVFEVGHQEGNGTFNDPNGGRYSIFAPRVIDNAVLQSGGFGAQFGRKSASYLGLGVKEGNLASHFASGQFDLLGGTLIYDGHVKKTGVLATARFLDFRPILNFVNREDYGNPWLGDFLIKTATQLNENHKLTILAMYNPEYFERGIEHIRFTKKVESTFLGKTENTKSLAGIQLRSLTGERRFWKNIVYYRTLSNQLTYGNSYPQFDASLNQINPESTPFESDLMKISNSQTEIGGRSIYNILFDKVRLIAGADVAYTAMDYERSLKHTDTLYTFTDTDFLLPGQYYTVIQPQQYNAKFNQSEWNASAYIESSIILHKNFTINPGLRFDYTGFTNENLLSPRFSASWRINNENSLSFAAGLFSQDPLLNDLADQSGNRKLLSEKAEHYILGYKNYFKTDWSFTSEFWYKRFDNLITRPFTGQVLLNNNGTGKAAGLDLSLVKRFSKKWHGQATFCYQYSVRNNNDGLGEFNSDPNQPMQATILGSYQLGEKWIVSGKFRYATGIPADEFIIHSNVLNDPTRLRYSQQIISNNSKRLADYISLDLRADYRKQFKKYALTGFVDIVNVLNRINQSAEYFQFLTGKTYFDFLAIFPTFGIRSEL